jgi:hypothetical protein
MSDAEQTVSSQTNGGDNSKMLLAFALVTSPNPKREPKKTPSLGLIAHSD